MVIYNDKRFITNSEHPNDDWVGNADWVIPDGSELAEKIKQLYPNFEFVFDDGGQPVDVTGTEPEPVPPVISLEQRVSAMEDATAEIIEILMGGE